MDAGTEEHQKREYPMKSFLNGLSAGFGFVVGVVLALLFSLEVLL